jgi:hypothetical protein
VCVVCVVRCALCVVCVVRCALCAPVSTSLGFTPPPLFVQAKAEAKAEAEAEAEAKAEESKQSNHEAPLPSRNPELERLSSLNRFAESKTEGGRVLFVNILTGMLDSAKLSKEDAAVIAGYITNPSVFRNSHLLPPPRLKDLYTALCVEYGPEKAASVGSFLMSNKVKRLLVEEFAQVSSFSASLTRSKSHTHTYVYSTPRRQDNREGSVPLPLLQNIEQGKRVAEVARLQAENKKLAQELSDVSSPTLAHTERSHRTLTPNAHAERSRQANAKIQKQKEYVKQKANEVSLVPPVCSWRLCSRVHTNFPSPHSARRRWQSFRRRRQRWRRRPR